MPNYATHANLVERVGAVILIQCTDDEQAVTDEDGGIVAAIVDNAAVGTRLDAAIDDAEQMINAYLRKQKLLTGIAASVPPLVKWLTCTLGIYSVHERRASTLEIPPDVRRRKDDAMKMLEQIAKGLITLGVEPVPTKGGQVVAEADGPDRTYTVDTLADF